MTSAPSPVTYAFELAGSNGRTIRGQAIEPPGARGTVVISHGFKGFSRWGFYPHLSNILADAGLRAVSFDFSGSGVGADRETFTDLEAFAENTYRRELADLATIAGECERRGWIERGYGLIGHSRGGGMAILHSARDTRVRALVTWAAIANVRNNFAPDVVASWRARGYLDVPNVRTGQILRLGTAVLDEVEQLEHTELNIEAAAARLAIPWLIVHGTADETVSVNAATTLHARASNGRAELMLVEGSNHGFEVTHPFVSAPPALQHVVKRTVQFCRQHLG